MITEFHIGIDDTDSLRGGCTTYTGTLVFQELCRRGFKPLDFPWLVRLNPNIPWKTRGNGAIAIHVLTSDDRIGEARQIVMEIVERTTESSAQGADPAVAFFRGPIPTILREYSSRALHEVLSVKHAREIAKNARADVLPIKGTRGIIGALAALGAGLETIDHTFEVIAYRATENLGYPRMVDSESIREIDSELGDSTFQNVDPETGRILICPHGPDPVLLGIRGRRPGDVMEAFKRVKIHEPVERIMIFRTNQGTDAHIRVEKSVSGLRPHQSAVVSGQVVTFPKTLLGGHVLFRVMDETGSVDCIAFEPSGILRKTARKLLPGDKVRVSGGVRRRSDGLVSLNLEKIEILQLAEAFIDENPKCPICGGRFGSMGAVQGFRCKKCSLRPMISIKDRKPLPRSLELSVCIPPPRSRRHLTKPNSLQNHPLNRETQDDFAFETIPSTIRAQLGIAQFV